MKSSVFSVRELPPRKCENMDARNGAISSGHVATGECHQRNYRDGFHGNYMACSSGDFHDMLPVMREFRSEASLCGPGHVHGSSAHLTCSCIEQQREFFYDDHDHHQSSKHKRCCRGITSSSTHMSNQTRHPRNFCEHERCGSVPMHRERSGVTNCLVDRTRASSGSSLFSDSFEFQRNAAAVGGMPHFPSTDREVETRSSPLQMGSMANSVRHVLPTQTKAADDQIFLYGWFLMKPSRESYTADPSTSSSVALGGYRCPRMQEKDFFATAPVVERLERWKLRTSDGLKVGLMGIINFEKSVANGFSPSLAQCFMIGFPSAWVYMLCNTCVSKSSSLGMPSPSASPTSSAGQPGITGNGINDCLGTPMTLPREANLVQSILQSPLFTGQPDVETRIPSLRKRYSTAPTTPLNDGVSSDANSAPQAHLGHEQVDAPKDGNNVCLETDLVLHEVAPQPGEPSLCKDASPSIREGVVAPNSGEAPETSSQTQIPKKFEGSLSDTNDVKVDDGREVSHGPSAIAKENVPDMVQLEVSNGGAATPDDEQNATELDFVAPDDVPCTPRMLTEISPDVTEEKADADLDEEILPDVTEEKADAELDGELEKEGSIAHKDDVDVEVNQSCKVTVGGRARGRRKRYKISRNYYQRGKKKSSAKSSHEKIPPLSAKSTTTMKIPIESPKLETDESQVVEELTTPPKKKGGRPTLSSKRKLPKAASSPEGPESSTETSDLLIGRQTKKCIVPPLPSPRVADKSEVMEAFGLKRSLHGRVLVPPLATWRSQHIEYDTDGGIIAITAGFTGPEEENCTGYNFKPPAEKKARTMRRRLCEAADKGSKKK